MESFGTDDIIMPAFDGFLGIQQESKPCDTLIILNNLVKSKQYGITWDQKLHDASIVVDPEYVPGSCFYAPTDTQLIHTLAKHLGNSGMLASCRGALWFHSLNETHVALPFDRVKRELIVNRLYSILQHWELCLPGEDTVTLITDSSTRLKMVCNSICGQALVDSDYENEYWRNSPNDNYSNAIRTLNKQICYIRDPGVYMEGFIEKTQKEVADLIASKSHLTIHDWLFCTQRREYERDDFIPTLVPESIPKGVFNVFQGLQIQYKDCKHVDVGHATKLIDMIRDSLCYGNDQHCQWYLKWLAQPLQAVERGDIGNIKTRVDVMFKGVQGGGKGCKAEHLSRIYGHRYCLAIESVDVLQGQFNKFLNESLFLILEEVGFAGNVKDAKAMKNKTTGSRAITNEKHAKIRTDRTRYYNTQEHCNPNSSDFARYTETDDRRVAIFQTDPKYGGQPSMQMFNDKWKPLFAEEVTLSFAKLLYEMGLSDFVACVSIPHTK
jgi:hypothetical protein